MSSFFNFYLIIWKKLPVINVCRFIFVPVKLGVNAYAFAITRDGYVVFHPNLRPYVST